RSTVVLFAERPPASTGAPDRSSAGPPAASLPSPANHSRREGGQMTTPRMPAAARAHSDTRADRPADRSRELVLTTIQDHASSLLAVARRYSLCADDAQDAYQRALEIFLRRAASLDPRG